MKRELAQIIYRMYCHLDNQYSNLLMKGSGRIIHDINMNRTAISLGLQLLEEALNKEYFPADITLERLANLLCVYDRKEKALVGIYKKLEERW